MFVRPLILAAAAVTAGLLSLSAASVPAFAQESRSIAVSYADLNLASADGRDVLDQRIASAASQLCGPSDGRDLVWARAVEACQQATIGAVQPQRDAAIGLRGTVQVSFNQALQVSRAVN